MRHSTNMSLIRLNIALMVIYFILLDYVAAEYLLCYLAGLGTSWFIFDGYKLDLVNFITVWYFFLFFTTDEVRMVVYYLAESWMRFLASFRTPSETVYLRAQPDVLLATT